VSPARDGSAEHRIPPTLVELGARDCLSRVADQNIQMAILFAEKHTKGLDIGQKAQIEGE
jgi:hypothetical protein